MTTLTVIAEGRAPAASSEHHDYIRDLTRSIVATTPRNCEVEAFLTSSATDERDYFAKSCPSAVVTLANRDYPALMRSWSLGLTGNANAGFVHSPTLFAPLRRHDVVNDGVQTTVTIHDTTLWTHPDELSTSSAMWLKTMVKRAHKHADAVVVPSHAVAENLSNYANFGDRVRVVTGGAPTRVLSASTANDKPIEPAISRPYAIVEGSLSAIDGLEPVIAAFGRSGNGEHEVDETQLVILSRTGIDAEALAEILTAHSVAADRVRVFNQPTGNEVRNLFSHATAHIVAGNTDRYASSVLTAFNLGVPTLHADTPILAEIAGDSGMTVKVSDLSSVDDLADAYRAALQSVLADDQARERLITLGLDRAKAFSWRETGERIWQIHAEL